MGAQGCPISFCFAFQLHSSKMAKAMKAMAAMKAMKAMKKKPVSFRTARRHLFSGKNSKTGKIVSKKQSANAKKTLGAWTAAVQKARKALNIKGFLAVKKGTPLYKKAKELYGQ